MSGLGRTAGLTPHDLYTQARLDNEKHLWADVAKRLSEDLYAGVLYLEPSVPESIPFTRSLAAYIREQLPALNQTLLLTNGIDAGKWPSGNLTLDVHTATSLNTWSQWHDAPYQLRNGDGFIGLNATTAAELIPKMVASPGPDGFSLWFQDYVGGVDGRSPLASWMLDI